MIPIKIKNLKRVAKVVKGMLENGNQTNVIVNSAKALYQVYYCARIHKVVFILQI